MFALEIRRQRVSRMRGFRHWRWHVDEVFDIHLHQQQRLGLIARGHAFDERQRRIVAHLADFMAAYNFARRLKTLSGIMPSEYITKIWTAEPDRFIANPIHQMPGLNT